jgi:hypothetical protein
MAVSYWMDDPDSWDSLEFSGDGWKVLFEGLPVEVDGDFGNDYDVKKSPGADGAPATNKGYDPCKPKVSWTLWTFDHWLAYQELLDRAQPKPGKTPPIVVTVVHPQLQLVKKSRFRIAKINTLKRVGPHMMQAQFELLEFFDAPKVIPKPSSLERPEEKRERAIYDIDFTPSKKVKPD